MEKRTLLSMNDSPKKDWRTVVAESKPYPQADAGFEPGDMIAKRYTVQKLLGRGGMGIVYLVYDQKTKRRVALKTLLPKFIRNQHMVARFVREVIAVRRFNHPGIVKMYDARRYGSLLYYTMEYLEGMTLRSYLHKRGHLELKPTCHILSLVCSALDLVHLVTVHRDISPENIMLLPNGSIKLLDFGLAKTEKKIKILPDGTIRVLDRGQESIETPATEQFTRVGQSLGKLRYNAPEQHADASTADRRADLYSLGIIFFEMLTGRSPEARERITNVLPDLPEACDYFLDKALATDPNERFSTATEFRRRLEHVYESSILEQTPAAPKLRRPIRSWLHRALDRLFRRDGPKPPS